MRDARRLTSLVGQVELDLSAEEFVNVDVIFKVIGLDAKKVLQRAMHIEFGQHGFLVMHPLDLLCSRTANLHEVPDKKNEKGALQLGLAISVAREFLRETAAGIAPADTAAGRSPLQPLVSEIERLALSDAGRKVAARWQQHGRRDRPEPDPGRPVLVAQVADAAGPDVGRARRPVHAARLSALTARRASR